MADPLELVAYSSGPALAVNGQQRILAINKAATDLLGRSELESLALTCNNLLGCTRPEGGRICGHRCEAIDGLIKLRPYESNCYVLRADGTSIPATLRTVAIPGDPTDRSRPVAIMFISPTDPAGVSAERSDERLKIHVLGQFSISLRGSSLEVERWPRKQAVQLLKLLVVDAGRPVHRERLIDHFWPEVDAQTGWTRLKVTMHFLRQKLREVGFQDVIETDNSSYVLRLDSVWIDANIFDDLARKGRAHQRAGRDEDALRCYEEAKQVYCGDFMEGDLYADWCAEERERLSSAYVELLHALAELHLNRGEFLAAAQNCHAALARERCRESLHRLLIKALIALGRQNAAISSFNRCRQILQTDLGVSPGPETVAVIAPLLAAASEGQPGILQDVAINEPARTARLDR